LYYAVFEAMYLYSDRSELRWTYDGGPRYDNGGQQHITLREFRDRRCDRFMLLGRVFSSFGEGE